MWRTADTDPPLWGRGGLQSRARHSHLAGTLHCNTSAPYLNNKFNLTLILILIFNKFCIQKISPKVRWLSTVDEAAHIYHTDTFFIACILISQSPLSSVIIFTNVPDVAAPGHQWPGWRGDATPSRAPEAAPRPRSAASCRTTFNEQQRSVARRTISF